jgi:hypothetical protein
MRSILLASLSQPEAVWRVVLESAGPVAKTYDFAFLTGFFDLEMAGSMSMTHDDVSESESISMGIWWAGPA